MRKVVIWGIVFTIGGLLNANLASALKPGTMETVDNADYGLVVNLFDYDAEDSWNSYAGNVRYSGINNYLRGFNFVSHGGTPSDIGDANTWTGDERVRRGIVEPLWNSAHYPVLKANHQGLDMLFSTEPFNGVKRVYKNTNHLFVLKDNRLEFDSNEHYAYYDIAQGDDGDFVVYNGTYHLRGIGSQPGDPVTENTVGFFPFDNYDEEKNDVSPLAGYNHYFGLTVSGDFHYPKNGLVNGDELVLEFGGDDDVWVFVDGVLTLDLGGIHGSALGKINFTSGEVNISTGALSTNYTESVIGEHSTLDQIFNNVGLKFDDSFGSEHNVTVFYLERGGCFSDLALSTNVWIPDETPDEAPDEAPSDIPEIVTNAKNPETNDDFIRNLGIFMSIAGLGSYISIVRRRH